MSASTAAKQSEPPGNNSAKNLEPQNAISTLHISKSGHPIGLFYLATICIVLMVLNFLEPSLGAQIFCRRGTFDIICSNQNYESLFEKRLPKARFPDMAVQHFSTFVGTSTSSTIKMGKRL